MLKGGRALGGNEELALNDFEQRDRRHVTQITRRVTPCAENGMAGHILTTHGPASNLVSSLPALSDLDPGRFEAGIRSAWFKMGKVLFWWIFVVMMNQVQSAKRGRGATDLTFAPKDRNRISSMGALD